MKFFFTAFIGYFSKRKLPYRGSKLSPHVLQQRTFSTAPSVVYFRDISCEYKLSVEFSGNFFSPHPGSAGFFLLHPGSAENFFSTPYSAGSGEKFSFTA